MANFKKGDRVQIRDDLDTVPEELRGKTGTIVAVKASPGSETFRRLPKPFLPDEAGDVHLVEIDSSREHKLLFEVWLKAI